MSFVDPVRTETSMEQGVMKQSGFGSRARGRTKSYLLLHETNKENHNIALLWMPLLAAFILCLTRVNTAARTVCREQSSVHSDVTGGRGFTSEAPGFPSHR